MYIYISCIDYKITINELMYPLTNRRKTYSEQIKLSFDNFTCEKNSHPK